MTLEIPIRGRDTSLPNQRIQVSKCLQNRGMLEPPRTTRIIAYIDYTQRVSHTKRGVRCVCAACALRVRCAISKHLQLLIPPDSLVIYFATGDTQSTNKISAWRRNVRIMTSSCNILMKRKHGSAKRGTSFRPGITAAPGH